METDKKQPFTRDYQTWRCIAEACEGSYQMEYDKAMVFAYLAVKKIKELIPNVKVYITEVSLEPFSKEYWEWYIETPLLVHEGDTWKQNCAILIDCGEYDHESYMKAISRNLSDEDDILQWKADVKKFHKEFNKLLKEELGK